MAAIGRLDIARAFKRLLELTGTYEPALGEGIVPTAQLFELEDTPFGPTVKWMWSGSQAAVAAEFSHVAVVPGDSLGENGWLTVDDLWVHNTTVAAAFVNIIPTVDAGVPFLSSMIEGTTTRSRRQPGFLQGTLWLVPEVRVLTDANATATATGGRRVFMPADPLGTHHLKLDVSIRRGGVLLISNNTVNQDLIISLAGRVHMTTAK